MKKTKQMNYQNELIAMFVLCAGTLLLCFLVGSLVSKEIIPEKHGEMAATVLVELLVLIVCWATVKKRTQQRFLTAVVMATAFCVLRLLAGVIINFGGEIHPLPCLITIAAGALGGVLGNAKKKRRR